MWKNILTFLIFALLFKFSVIKAQIYVFDGNYFHEKLILHEDGNFKYTLREYRYIVDITGNWHICNDSVLVLDSHPQTRSIIVREECNSKEKGAEIYVWNPNGKPFDDFNITVISTENDTVNYLVFDLKPVCTDFNIKAFYLIDYAGYKTETYKVKCGNKIDLIYDNKRAFANEHWIIKDKYIIPRGKDRTLAKYRMYKIEE